MSPKQRQNNAQQSKWSENAYHVLADLPHDGSTPTFDGRDGKIDEVDGNSAGKPFQSMVLAGSPVPSPSTHQQQTTPEHNRCRDFRRDLVTAMRDAIEKDNNDSSFSALFCQHEPLFTRSPLLPDLPHDGSTPTFDGRDGKVDEVDGYSAGKPFQSMVLAGSPVPSPSTHQQQTHLSTTSAETFAAIRLLLCATLSKKTTTIAA
ncbi:hypothetical protein BZA77DRAFT_362710 [Pyronema omphalodes]|nr:hypothetical protein BZA77DRAFT_362710 [Pyronema omphalodes]